MKIKWLSRWKKSSLQPCEPEISGQWEHTAGCDGWGAIPDVRVRKPLQLVVLEQGTCPAGKGHHSMGQGGRRDTGQPGCHAPGTNAFPALASNSKGRAGEAGTALLLLAKMVQFW